MASVREVALSLAVSSSLPSDSTEALLARAAKFLAFMTPGSESPTLQAKSGVVTGGGGVLPADLPSSDEVGL